MDLRGHEAQGHYFTLVRPRMCDIRIHNFVDQKNGVRQQIAQVAKIIERRIGLEKWLTDFMYK